MHETIQRREMSSANKPDGSNKQNSHPNPRFLRLLYLWLFLIGGSVSLAGAQTFHTISIDGVNDFSYFGEEVFATTSTDFFGYLTWDETHLYLGMEGADVGTGYGDRYVVAYISSDTTSGTMTGMNYAGCQPNLPFPADYHFRWRVDGGDTALFSSDGIAWSPATFTGAAARGGDYVEFSIPLSNIGNPDRVRLVWFMVIQGVWTFSGVPEGAFTDGVDPDIGQHQGYYLDDWIYPSLTGLNGPCVNYQDYEVTTELYEPENHANGLPPNPGFSWQCTADWGSSEGMIYWVRVNNELDGTYTTVCETSTTTCVSSVSLDPDTQYYVHVWASNDGFGEFQSDTPYHTFAIGPGLIFSDGFESFPFLRWWTTNP